MVAGLRDGIIPHFCKHRIYRWLEECVQVTAGNPGNWPLGSFSGSLQHLKLGETISSCHKKYVWVGKNSFLNSLFLFVYVCLICNRNCEIVFEWIWNNFGLTCILLSRVFEVYKTSSSGLKARTQGTRVFALVPVISSSKHFWSWLNSFVALSYRLTENILTSTRSQDNFFWVLAFLIFSCF